MGTFYSAQMAVAQMQKQGTGGSVVMIASITSHVSEPCLWPDKLKDGLIESRLIYRRIEWLDIT
jgi:hypothetical protein